METTTRRRIVGHRSEVVKSRPVKFFDVYPEDLEVDEVLCMQGAVKDVEEDVAELFARLRIAGAY
jgi:hypothetical protein